MMAHATLKMKNDIATSLGLIDPVHIEESPDCPNIFFSALARPDRRDNKLEPVLIPLIEELKTKCLDFPATIVYGSLKIITEYFSFTGKVMGPSQYEPVETSQVAINKLFTQFHANFPEHERERIVKYLVSGKVKIL